ncbi:hypothetical protein ACHAXN_011474 [Cyclotella atomus]
MKFINNALALLIVKSVSAKLNDSKDRNLQLDNMFGAVANATGIDATTLEGIGMNSTFGSNFTDMMGGGMNFTDMMGGGMPEGAVPFDLNGTLDALANATTDLLAGFNTTALEGIDMNSTEGLTQEQLEGIFGSNLTDLLGGLSNMTMPTGFGFTMPTGMGMDTCPDTCPPELCPEALTAEGAIPDEHVIADSCDAGTIGTCFAGMEMICGFLCGDEPVDLSAFGLNLTTLGVDDSMLEMQCVVCKLLECCDGTNSYADTCSAHTAAILGGDAAAGTGATPAAGSTVAATTDGADAADGEDTEHDDEDGHDHEHDDEDGHDHEDDAKDALEGGDSAASGQFISTVASAASIVLLFIAF